MIRPIFAGLLLFGLFVGFSGIDSNVTAQTKSSDKDKKDTKELPKEEMKKGEVKPSTKKTTKTKEPKEEKFKDEWPDAKGVVALVQSVDLSKKSAEIELADGKKMTIKVDEKTEYLGPMGGVSKLGLRDDRFEQGLYIKVDLDGTTAKTVHFARRKSTK